MPISAAVCSRCHVSLSFLKLSAGAVLKRRERAKRRVGSPPSSFLEQIQTNADRILLFLLHSWDNSDRWENKFANSWKIIRICGAEIACVLRPGISLVNHSIPAIILHTTVSWRMWRGVASMNRKELTFWGSQNFELYSLVLTQSQGTVKVEDGYAKKWNGGGLHFWANRFDFNHLYTLLWVIAQRRSLLQRLKCWEMKVRKV